MPRKRRWGGPPPLPPATTFVVCHPADDWYARFLWPERTNESLVLTDRCPMQHIIQLPLKLKLLAQSGAWFDAPDAEWVRGALLYQQDLSATLEGTDKPRCQALNADSSQCSRGAVADEYQGRMLFCKVHSRKRRFTVHKPGAGLDQVNENPLSRDALGELSDISGAVGRILYELQWVQQRIVADDEIAEKYGTAYAELFDARARIDAIVRGDRERDAMQRHELGQRIRRMVDRICLSRNMEGVDVHMAFIRSGGKKQDLMTIEELKGKVNWLLNNYPDLFADTREWQPPDIVVSGMEPGGIRVAGPEDPVIEEVSE